MVPKSKGLGVNKNLRGLLERGWRGFLGGPNWEGTFWVGGEKGNLGIWGVCPQRGVKRGQLCVLGNDNKGGFVCAKRATKC